MASSDLSLLISPKGSSSSIDPTTENYITLPCSHLFQDHPESIPEESSQYPDVFMKFLEFCKIKIALVPTSGQGIKYTGPLVSISPRLKY